MHDDEPDDWEAEEDFDEDDDSTIVVACPSCGKDVYEDAERCPSCGDYIVPSTSPWLGRPRWWILLGLLGGVALIWALVF